MKNKRNIYCEYAFWEAFFEMEEQVLRDRSKRKLWDDFYDFLTDNHIFFNIDTNHVKESTPGGQNLMMLRQAKGGAGIKFIPETFPKLEEISDDDDDILNSVFLTMAETSECKSLSRGLGMIIFNLSMVFSAEHVYIDNGVSFDKSNGHNWTYLWDLKDKYPGIDCCNSLILADRYLLHDVSESAIDANLRPIFEALLPQYMDNGIFFTICIIAENKGRPVGEKYKKIDNLIREIRPELDFSLNIYRSKGIHDRSIITNNVILISGAGFDVIGLDEQPLKFTTTSLNFPFLQKDKNDKYLVWINNVLKEQEKCCAYESNYWGDEDKRHHLLDYYYEEPVGPSTTFSLGSEFSELLSALTG